MQKTYQYRMDLNAHQKARFAENAGCSRWVYNHYLHQQIERTKQGLPMRSYADCLKDLKMQIGTKAWLQAVDAQMLICSLRHLIQTYKDYMNHYSQAQSDFPAFQKKKAYPKFYFLQVRAKCLDLQKEMLDLPDIGKVKLQIDQAPEGKICHVMLVEKNANQFFISLTCQAYTKKKYVYLSHSILSSEDLAHIKRANERLQKMRRKLERKCEQSQNYMKGLEKIRKLEIYIQHLKRDLLHKQSKKWVQKNDVIIVKEKKATSKNQVLSDRDCHEFL